VGGVTTAPWRAVFAPFRYRAYRAIWAANLASNMGSMVQAVGAAWLMADLTHSHRMVALVQSSNVAPTLLLGLVAGALADRHDRRRIMLGAQGMMLLLSLALAVIALRGAITPALLLLFTMGVGAGTALNQPAWQASVRWQVGREALPQAITLNAVAFNLARCLGPALGGLLMAWVDVGWAFAINALSYVGLVLALLAWRPDMPRHRQGPILPAIVTGLGHCAASPAMRRIVARGLAIGIGIAAWQGLVPMVVRENLHGGTAALGLLLGMFGVGSLAAAPLVQMLRQRLGADGTIMAAVGAFVAALVGLALARGLAGAAPAAALAGAGWVIGMTTLSVQVQVRAPEALLGRCIATYQAATYGCMALGAWVWGTLADLAGTRVSLCAAAAWLALALPLLRILWPLADR
jgi:MFS family permease